MTTATAPRRLRPDTWRSLGTIVDLPVTDPNACKLAGLDWTVTTDPLLRYDAEAINSHVVTVRSDTRQNLGVVGKGYTPVQNADLFEFMKSLNDYADVIIDTAGCLDGGQTVFIRGKCRGLSFDIGGDLTEAHILLVNGHAANRKLGITPMVEREVCTNGMRMVMPMVAGRAMGTLSTGYSLRHSKGITNTLESIKDAYMKATTSFKATEAAMRLLASKPLTDKQVEALFTETFIKPKAVDQKGDTADLTDLAADESVRAATIRAAREKRLHELLASPTNQHPGTRNTLYSAFQAVTEYLDHDSAVRTETGTEEAKEMARFASAHFGGTADETKERALQVALSLAGA